MALKKSPSLDYSFAHSLNEKVGVEISKAASWYTVGFHSNTVAKEFSLGVHVTGLRRSLRTCQLSNPSW